jgi:hypothetical protein
MSVTTNALEPLPRCCPSHDDWPTLGQHLVDEFPEIALADIVRELGQAKAAVVDMALPHEDALDTAELIARHQLLLLGGRIEDVARLDPERHVRRH